MSDYAGDAVRHRRYKTAILLSVLVHLLLWWISGWARAQSGGSPAPGVDEKADPIELVFARPRTVVDEPPADPLAQREPPEETPYLAERAARARDLVPGGDDRTQPASEGSRPLPVLRSAPPGQPSEAPASPMDSKEAREASDELSQASAAEAPGTSQEGDVRRPGPAPAGRQAPGTPGSSGPKFLKPPPAPASGRPAPGVEHPSSLTLSAPDRNAAGEGALSLSTYAWRWMPYIRGLQKKIQSNWVVPPAFSQLGLIEGENRVKFRIWPNGRIDGPELMRSSTYESLDLASLGSVRASAPVSPLPDDFPDEFLDIQVTYYYWLPDRDARTSRESRGPRTRRRRQP